MMKKYSVTIAGHATSISLEPPFWRALQALAHTDGKSVNQLILEIDSGREGNLSSAIRVYVLERVQNQHNTEGTHR